MFPCSVMCLPQQTKPDKRRGTCQDYSTVSDKIKRMKRYLFVTEVDARIRGENKLEKTNEGKI